MTLLYYIGCVLSLVLSDLDAFEVEQMNVSSALFIASHYLGHCSERTRVFAEFSLTAGRLDIAECKNSGTFSNGHRSALQRP